MHRFLHKKQTIVVTTDVNGTTTPHNTFGEIVRADGLYNEMQRLMKSYTTGNQKFSAVLPHMRSLASKVTRNRLLSYARRMPLYPGVTSVFDELGQCRNIDAKVALSTTGFAGLMALVNKLRHRNCLRVAASPVLTNRLTEEEKTCLIRPITEEEDKVQVIDDLVDLHRPDNKLVFHVGDTMGDFPAIRHVAERGGWGIAFNPNDSLQTSISSLRKDVRRRISIIDFKTDEKPDYTSVGNVIKETVWKTLKMEL